MFIAALFIIARIWKQPRCPSADEWIRKLWYIYTKEYYSAIKQNTFESVLMRWMKLEPIFFLQFTFYFYFILLYNTVLVLPYINMNLQQVYTCSQSWTPLLPPSPCHLSGSSQCTSPKHPVSCIEPRLAIHFLYDITYVCF